MLLNTLIKRHVSFEQVCSQKNAAEDCTREAFENYH